MIVLTKQFYKLFAVVFALAFSAFCISAFRSKAVVVNLVEVFG